jgi:2-keto-4-pentenoate hydratase
VHIPSVDPQLLAATREQLQRRDARLRRGAQKIGWKLGMGRGERVGEHVGVGYLITDTVLDDGERYSIAARGDGDLHVDAELCVELRADIDWPADAQAVRATIGKCWLALEIVDLFPRAGEPQSIVTNNVFHRAVAFGETAIPLVSDHQGTVHGNGERRDRAPWPVDVPDRVVSAASVLAALHERMRAGERIITGSITQLPIAVGDLLEADFGGYARMKTYPLVLHELCARGCELVDRLNVRDSLIRVADV